MGDVPMTVQRKHTATLFVLMLVAVPALAMSQTGPVFDAEGEVWGTSTAEISTDPGFEGYWKYCIEINWDLKDIGPWALSHASLLLGEDCVCECNDTYFAFADTIGSGPGEGGCEVYYYAELECEGDPTIPFPEPTLKFEPFEGDCEPDVVGTAYLCFYSFLFPTSHGTFEDCLVVKFSTRHITGDLEGVLPLCDPGASATERSTWGAIKVLCR